jgi:hypothetical protein
MPTKAQLVREALETEIKKVSGIGHVSSQPKLWKDESNLPAAYVILDSDDSRFEPTESKTVECRFRIATVLQSENPQDVFDDLRGAIETEIEDDPSLGGLADVAFVSGVGGFATSVAIAGQVYVRNIFVDVTYKHARGAP